MSNETQAEYVIPTYLSIGQWIATYGLSLIYLPAGIVGNTLCILVMLRRENVKNSVCNYMLALACADLTFLICIVWYITSTYLYRYLYKNLDRPTYLGLDLFCGLGGGRHITPQTVLPGYSWVCHMID